MKQIKHVIRKKTEVLINQHQSISVFCYYTLIILYSGFAAPLHSAEGLRLFRLGVFYAESVGCYALDYLRVKRLVGVVGVTLGYLVYNVHSLGDFAEGGILTVKVRRFLVHNKEL